MEALPMDNLDLTFQPPARSILFSPEPCGLGSPLIEGLASYLARLAHAHHVNSAELLQYIVAASNVHLSDDPRWRHLTTQVDSRRLNGSQAVAARWGNAAANLTQRSTLEHLTLLPWQHLLTPIRLLHATQHWCPVCLHQWKQDDATLYWPLIWSIRSVLVCAIHRQPLLDRCPSCYKKLPALSWHGVPGFCSHCHTFLGSSIGSVVPDVSDADLVLAKQVGELLTAGQHSINDVSVDKLVRILRLGHIPPHGLHTLVAHAANVSVNSASRLLRRERPLTVTSLFQFLDGLGISIGDFIALPFETLSTLSTIQDFVRRCTELADKPRIPSFKIRVQAITPTISDEIETRLKAALTLSKPPMLTTLARELGVANVQLLQHGFPDLCSSIVQKRLHHLDVDAARQQLVDHLNNPDSTVVATELARQLHTSITTLAKQLPNEVAQLIRKQNLSARMRLLKPQIESYLAHDQPIPVGQICQSLGIHKGAIRDHFPDLNHQLVQRYRSYRRAERQKERNEQQIGIFEAVQRLIDAGKYPSKNAVAVALGKRGWPILTQRDCVLYRQALQKHGLS